jgi:hypothetical protein
MEEGRKLQAGGLVRDTMPTREPIIASTFSCLLSFSPPFRPNAMGRILALSMLLPAPGATE